MSTTLYTSLTEIKSFFPCSRGWKNILKGQGKTKADDVLFPLTDCLKSNSISDVCWLLGKRKIEIDIAIKFAKKCADSVSHIKNAAANSAVAHAGYAADAAAAGYAGYAVSYAAAAYAYAAAVAYDKQLELNKQFLIDCIKDWEESH
jgi:hypothetical protein